MAWTFLTARWGRTLCVGWRVTGGVDISSSSVGKNAVCWVACDSGVDISVGKTAEGAL